jgi:DNA-binding response OmpR family regulator
MKPKALVISRLPAAIYVGVARLLSAAGYRVDITEDLTAGLAKLRRHPYDIIVNIESPRDESWQTCAGLRRVTDTPVIVISPRASVEGCVRAINAGADYFLRKSCGPLELLARIRSLRQRRRSTGLALLGA